MQRSGTNDKQLHKRIKKERRLLAGDAALFLFNKILAHHCLVQNFGVALDLGVLGVIHVTLIVQRT